MLDIILIKIGERKITKHQRIFFMVLAVCALASCNLAHDPDNIQKLTSEKAVKQYLASHYPATGRETTNNNNIEYDVSFPYTEGKALSNLEKSLVLAYLNHSADIVLAKNLADFHIKKSVIHSKKTASFNGENLRHSILAQYFLERSVELGDKSRVTTASLGKVKAELDALIKKDTPLENDWNRASHNYFINAFNYQEKNRHAALDALLEDFVVQPNNVFTAFYIQAAALWNGSESAYDDPTILYNYVVSSFFSLHAMSLAQTLENNWVKNPEQYRPFRLAHILGGVSIIQRQWLATLHNDQAAIALIDEEHWAWYKVSPIFHSYTLAVAMFDEPHNSPKAFQAINDGILSICFTIPDIRTCKNSARIPFNGMGTALSVIDYLVKMGEVEKAKQFLGARVNPEFGFAEWNLGKASLEYREKNIDDLAARFSNKDPSDDPLMFGLKAKKWGTHVLTCQYCHQAQGRQWTEEQKSYIQLPSASTTKLSQWPAVSTTWYGTVKR